MSTTVDLDLPPVQDLTLEEGRAFAEAAAQRLLGISMDEFIRRYDAGEYNDVYDTSGHWHIGRLEMLIDVVR